MKRAEIFVTGIALAALIAAVSALPVRAQGQPLQGPKIPLPEQPRRTQIDTRPVGPGPATLEARALNPVTVQLAWAPVPGAAAYAIVRDPSGQRQLLYQGLGPFTQVFNKEYYYRVVDYFNPTPDGPRTSDAVQVVTSPHHEPLSCSR